MTIRMFVLLITVGSVGCATTVKGQDKIHAGMTRAEVIEAMGEPESKSFNGISNREGLYWGHEGLKPVEFCVQIYEDKVVAYDSKKCDYVF